MAQSRTEIRDRLNKVFQETFDDESIEINDETTAADIDEWDSLMHITLVIAVERQFGMQLKADEVGKLKNVGEMVTVILERGI